MKKLISLIFLTAAICALSFSSCRPDNTPLPELYTDAPGEISFEADGTGGVNLINVTTNQPSWNYTLDPSDGGWLTVGSADNIITLSATPNELIQERGPVVIRITAGDAIPVEITVRQRAAAPTLIITPALTSVSFNADGTTDDETTFTVHTNSPGGWDVILDPGSADSWLILRVPDGGSFTLSAKENKTTREHGPATIRVTAEGADPVEITVTQDADETTLSVTPALTSVTFNADGTTNDEATFTVHTNYHDVWLITLDPSDGGGWLSVSSIAGYSGDSFTFSAEENETTGERGPVTVRVTAGEADPVEITVTQNAADDMDGVIAVGSYYYANGKFSSQYHDSQGCLGVVWYVDQSGRHGKVISLDQSDNLEWYRLSGVTTDATSEDNGAENTAKINSLPDLIYYYAFKWCIDKGDGWYLPARGELEALKTVWDTDFDGFNAKMTAAGGTIISVDGRYWSSTERTFNTAFYMDYTHGILNAMKIVDGFSVRAMIAF